MRSGPAALLASLVVAGCAGAPPEKPVNILTEHGALLMQAAPDPDSKRALARMLCVKQGLGEGTPVYARCVTDLYGRDRALSRARVEREGRGKVVRIPLCLGPGDFTLGRCYDI